MLILGSCINSQDQITENTKLNPTEGNPQGPFYRKESPFRAILIQHNSEGQRLHISGYVKDTEGKPVANAIIDIWHADNNGLYDNDTPDFNCRGKVKTNEDGLYFFDTILPAHSESRPAHIHFTITAEGYNKLTTQLYFKSGDQRNEEDPNVRKSLMIEAKEGSNHILEGEFNIVIIKR